MEQQKIHRHKISTFVDTVPYSLEDSSGRGEKKKEKIVIFCGHVVFNYLFSLEELYLKIFDKKRPIAM